MPIHATVRHENGVFAIESDIGYCISHEIADSANLDVTQTANFAAWALLPIGMTLGRDIVIENAGDSVTEKNARTLSEIWFSWLPQKFKPISVSFQSHKNVPPAITDEELVFFSGGIDSTYNLLKRMEDGKKQVLLTVDFGNTGPEQFSQLLSRTGALASAASDSRLIVRTNVFRIYKQLGIRPDIGHGFALASVGFLWDGILSGANIAADSARFQEPIWYPWGTNSVTNELFKSSSFGLDTSCLSLTRSQKIHELSENPAQLDSLVFCTNRKIQPKNCGTCSKCVRTKAMFLATAGHIPNIFVDSTWDGKFFKSIESKLRKERVYLIDIYMEAAKRGRTIPGLNAAFRKLVLDCEHSTDKTGFWPSIKKSFNKLMKPRFQN